LVAHSGIFGDFGTSGIGTTIGIAVMVIIVLILAGVMMFFLALRYLFNKKLVIFEKIGGQIQVSKRDAAREIRLGQAGDTAFVTRRTRKTLPRGDIQTGKNIYWYFIRGDGEWINFGIEDIDEVMKTMGAKFVDKDMRYARLGLQKNFERRFQKVTFWDKYGAWIMWTTYLLVTGIMTWLLFDKFIDLAGEVSNIVDSADRIMERSEQVLVSLDNVCTGGTGLVSA